MLLDYLSSLHPSARNEEIALVLSPEDVYDPSLGIADGYTFSIYQLHPRRRVGYISLRMGESPALYYLGHIGYRIEPLYRGHGYAAQACTLLVPFMRELGLRSVCITANPENTPSRKTCEKAGCELESIVPVPPAYRAVCSGAEYKCRYILIIAS